MKIGRPTLVQPALRRRRRAEISKNGKSFLVHCRASGVGRRRCQITARWKKSKRKVVTIGRGSRTIPAGKRSTLVRVKLTKTGRKLLRRHPRGTKIRINLKVTDQIGQVATNTRRIKLRLSARGARRLGLSLKR